METLTDEQIAWWTKHKETQEAVARLRKEVVTSIEDLGTEVVKAIEDNWGKNR